MNGGLEIANPLHSSTPKRYEEEALDAELFGFLPEYDESMSGERDSPVEDAGRAKPTHNDTYVSPGGREYAVKVKLSPGF